MASRFAEYLVDIFTKSRRYTQSILLLILFLLLLPIGVTDYLHYGQSKRHLTEIVFSSMQSVADTAAMTFKERFNRLVDLSTSFATRVQFRKLIREGNWEDAVKILEEVPFHFPFVERVFLADPRGTLMADTPPLPGVRGKNFSFRDWYKGVIEKKAPYISEVYKRAAEPRHNVVAVASPIESNGELLGILVLQIRLDTLLGWSQESNTGKETVVYFVDRSGNVAGHPKFPPQGEIINFMEALEVRKVLQGERGVEIVRRSPEEMEQIVAYKQVPEYGWGVLVEQAALIALAPQNKVLQRILIRDGVILLTALVIFVLLLRFLGSLSLFRQKETIMMRSIGDGLMAIDRFWNITLWNDAAEAMTGLKREEALGKPFRDVIRFVREENKAENIVFIEEAMLTGEARVMEGNTLLIGKEGREVPVEDSASPIFDSRGRVEGAVIVFRDVSEKREMERKKIDAEHFKREFLFRTIHDLQNPATAIKLTLETMQMTNSVSESEDLKEGIDLLKGANQRISKLLEDLLKVARGAGKSELLKNEAVFLPKVVRSTLKELSPLLDKKGIRVDYEPPTDFPRAEGNADALKEVFENLIENSIKYNDKEEGKIVIRHEVDGSLIATSIQDNGMGISEENIPKLFTPYFRAGNEILGTGLGLYIIRGIVEKMGGKIDVQSILGEGSTFRLLLPKA